MINFVELRRETQTNQIELTHKHILATHSHYLNEEVDHVCVIALHRVHEWTLATFNVLIRNKIMEKVSGCREGKCNIRYLAKFSCV